MGFHSVRCLLNQPRLYNESDPAIAIRFLCDRIIFLFWAKPLKKAGAGSWLDHKIKGFEECSLDLVSQGIPTIIEKNFITLPTQDVSEEKASLMTSVINSFLIYFLIRHPFYVIYESL